jgi:Tfp pilus assembly protein PilN
MRLKINLASQPYQDARRFMIAWSSVVGVLALLLIVLTIGVVAHWRHFRQRSADLSREQQVLADLQAKQQQDLEILNRPDNQPVRQKSEFINDLIHRKEVSWTTIFTDLEQLMPSHLHVIAVAPHVKDDKITIRMDLGGDSRDRATELARRMEQSRVFRDALIISESSVTQSGPGPGSADTLRFAMTAEYVPGQTLEKPGAQKTEEAGGGK